MTGDDDALVRGCLNEDVSALRAFVNRFQGMVFGLCFRILGHREDAEDIAQEVFLRIFRSLHRWDSDRPLKPWILQIAVNRCRTELAKRTRRPTQSGIVEESLSCPNRRQDFEMAEELQRALDGLREDYRTCFVLFYQQELSCAEIAETLDCPEGTVKTWLRRARRELVDELRRRGITPESSHELRRV